MGKALNRAPASCTVRRSHGELPHRARRRGPASRSTPGLWWSAPASQQWGRPPWDDTSRRRLRCVGQEAHDKYGLMPRYHRGWRDGRPQIAAAGGGPKVRQECGQAVASIARSASARPGRSTPPEGGMTSGDPSFGWREGTRGTCVGISAGPRAWSRPLAIVILGGTGRAAELASEAARAEGASLTRHDRGRQLAVMAAEGAHPVGQGGRGVPSHFAACLPGAA
jgi:hypothetical protein